MDFDEALLLIEEQLESSERFDLEKLAKYFPVVASHPDGFSGKVWEYGSRVMELARQNGGDDEEIFQKIGWDTYKSAIFSGISQKSIIQVFSFTQHNFIGPQNDIKTILNDPRIKTAIKSGIKVQERPFINPSDFAILASRGQDAFAEFLTVVDGLQVDDELRLQWSASMLRFCSPNSRSYIVASEVMLKTLIKNQKHFSAYYLFRALSGNCDDLWISYVSLELVKALIQNHIDSGQGLDILKELCSDIDVQQKCKAHRNLVFLIGILSIYLWSEYEIADVETMAWEFSVMIQQDYPGLSSLLASYITSRKLPDLPPHYEDGIRRLETELSNLINEAQEDLRERAYRGVPLAIKIHHENLKNIFIPILEKIKHRNSMDKILAQIEEIDPEALISENEHQRKNNFPIQGKLLQQMIKDNHDIKKSLRKAGHVLKQIQEIQYERSLISREQYGFYDEFEIFCEELSVTGQWAFEQLLPDLWKTLIIGLKIYKREEDNYGTR